MSRDREQSSNSLRYQWDLDHDGLMDTPVLKGEVFHVKFDSPGNRQVRLRVFDCEGTSSLSEPVAIRVLPAMRDLAGSINNCIDSAPDS